MRKAYRARRSRKTGTWRTRGLYGMAVAAAAVSCISDLDALKNARPVEDEPPTGTATTLTPAPPTGDAAMPSGTGPVPSDASSTAAPDSGDPSGEAPEPEAGPTLSDAGTSDEAGPNPPAVLSLEATLPTSGATGVAQHASIILEFNQEVTPGNGMIALRRTSDDLLIEQAAMDDARVTISGKTLTFDPDIILAPETSAYVTLDEGALKTLADKLFPGFDDPKALTFLTSPSNLPGGDVGRLVLWLDSSLQGSFRLTSANEVVVWADRSGNGHLFRPITTSGPKRGTAMLNSLPVVAFSGAEVLAADDPAPAPWNAFDLFVIVRGEQAPDAELTHVVTYGRSVHINWGHQDATNRHGVWGFFSDNRWRGAAFTPPAAGRSYLWNGTFRDTVGALESFTDGRRSDMTPVAPTSQLTQQPNLLAIGGSSTGEQRLQGDIAELLLFNSTLDATQRSALSGYLKSKWDIK